MPRTAASHSAAPGAVAPGTAAERAPHRRGAYAKGVAKREEILTAALAVIAREGYAGASVKALAHEVGLSQAGLLHYFGTKEELFTAILRKRDEADAELMPDSTDGAALDTLREAYLAVVRRNSHLPGMVELFSRVAVDAADPAHPAHAFFVERSAALRSDFAASIAAGQRTGAVPPGTDPDTLARVLQAVTDGLQLQWMLEPDIDMAAIIDALFQALGAAARKEP